MINWGIVGAGSWLDKYHISVLKNLEKKKIISLKGIWNRTNQKAEELASRYNIARVYNSFDQLLQDKSLDCVTIVLNKSVADKYIKKVAESGIPFIAEKPPADTYSDALKLFSVVGSLSHIIGFNRRYVPLVKLAGEYITSSPQGYEINMWRRNRIDFRYIFETGIHAINLAEYLFGSALQAQIVKKWSTETSSPYVLLKLKHNDCEGYINFQAQAGDSREQIRIYWKDRIMEMFIHQPLAVDHIEILRVFENGEWKVISGSNKPVNELTAYGFTDEYTEMIELLSGRGQARSNMKTSLSCLRIAEWAENSNEGDILSL